MSNMDVHTKIYKLIFKSWNLQTLKLYNKLNYIKLWYFNNKYWEEILIMLQLEPLQLKIT